MFKRPFFALLLIALLLAGCAPAFKSAAPAASDVAGGFSAPEAAPQAPREAATDNSFGQAAGNAVEIERVVIMNASLDIVVADPAEAMQAITAMTEEMGGFVVSSSLFKTRTSQGLEVPQVRMTVRVPAKRRNEALGQIKALVEHPDEDVLNENVTGEDVTREYTDLKSRLRNQEQAAEQLRSILAEARRTEDVLNVYNELSRVTEQIEVLKGQIQYYEESARLSAVSVNIRSQESVAPLSIGGWKPVGTARDALQALIDAFKFLANAAIWVVIFCLPIGLLLGIPAYFIIRGFLRYKARRKASQPQTGTEA